MEQFYLFLERFYFASYALIACLVIFYFSPFKSRNWQKLFLFFAVASVADTISTLFAVHKYGWASEANLVIKTVGPYLGFDLTLISVNLLIPIIIYYAVGKLFGDKTEIVKFIFFASAAARGTAAIFNTVIYLWTP
ncbi:MAG: hypothetical protein AAB378_01685 [Patescibacteria group bacterium]